MQKFAILLAPSAFFVLLYFTLSAVMVKRGDREGRGTEDIELFAKDEEKKENEEEEKSKGKKRKKI